MSQIIVIEDINEMIENLTYEAKQELSKNISGGQQFVEYLEYRYLTDYLEDNIKGTIDSASDKLEEMKAKIASDRSKKKSVWSDPHYEIYMITGQSLRDSNSYVLFFNCDVAVVNTCAETGGLNNFLKDCYKFLHTKSVSKDVKRAYMKKSALNAGI